jgi:hypothetical protein
MPYQLVKRVPNDDNDTSNSGPRNLELEALIIDLVDSKLVNYVFAENMPSASVFWNVGVMLKLYWYLISLFIISFGVQHV